MGLGLILELPMIIIDVQRGGPSTGLPTKTEQSDLMMAMYGRNGESPLPIIAARSPSDCFQTAIEAWQIATRYMTPVVILSDGYIANGAEPWKIPEIDTLPKIEVSHPTEFNGEEEFLPYKRDENLARPWALPGTPDLMHRVGGLEKQDGTGNVSYDPANHQHMVETRAKKVEMVADFVDEAELEGSNNGTPCHQLGRNLRCLPYRSPNLPRRRYEHRARPPPLDQPFPAQPRIADSAI